MSKIYKEHRQLNYEKKIDLRIGQDLDWHFLKEDTQMKK
jgi:hypothetical protein